MYSVSPTERERFYLRLLRLHIKGSTSFQDIMTAEGNLCGSFYKAAKQLGLLDDDGEWRECLLEVSTFQMPKQLRQMFAYICVSCMPSDVPALWNEFRLHFLEDFSREFVEIDSTNRALWDIQETLKLHGYTCQVFGLPVPNKPNEVCSESYHAIAEAEQGTQMRGHPNDEQEADAAEILQSLEDPAAPKQFFIDGPGGTGQTYIYRCLLHILRGTNLPVIPVAWTRTAANLLKGGRTSHSLFKFPLHLDETSVSGIKPQSLHAKNPRNAALIRWVEAPLAPKTAISVLDRLLKDLMRNDLPFGGKLIVFGGDFCQVLPVVRHESRTATVKASFQRSWWPAIEKRKLQMNMPTGPGQVDFSNWLLRLGKDREFLRHCLL